MKLFIKCASHDSPLAHRISEVLVDKLTVEVFVDNSDGDQNFFEVMVLRRLHEADLILVLITNNPLIDLDNSEQTSNLQREFKIALYLHKPLVVVGVDDLLVMPSYLPPELASLRRQQRITLNTSDFDRSVQKLIERLQHFNDEKQDLSDQFITLNTNKSSILARLLSVALFIGLFIGGLIWLGITHYFNPVSSRFPAEIIFMILSIDVFLWSFIKYAERAQLDLLILSVSLLLSGLFSIHILRLAHTPDMLLNVLTGGLIVGVVMLTVLAWSLLRDSRIPVLPYLRTLVILSFLAGGLVPLPFAALIITTGIILAVLVVIALPSLNSSKTLRFIAFATLSTLIVGGLWLYLSSVDGLMIR